MLKRKRDGESSNAAGGDPPLPPGTAELTYVKLSFAKVPIFSACSVEELDHVSKVTTVREAAAGERIVEEGDAGREFFVILHGDAVVTRGGVEVDRLSPGNFFGELSLFDPAPRNATVTATTHLEIAVITKAAFQRILGETTIRENIFLGMARRLHELDARA